MAESVSGYIVFLGFRGSVVRQVSIFFFFCSSWSPSFHVPFLWRCVCVCARSVGGEWRLAEQHSTGFT